MSAFDFDACAGQLGELRDLFGLRPQSAMFDKREEDEQQFVAVQDSLDRYAGYSERDVVAELAIVSVQALNRS